MTRVEAVSQSGVGSPAEAMLASFAQRHGIVLELSAGQQATLADTLARHGGTLAEVYLGLCAVGVGLVPRDADDSRERVRRILDAAYQIWVGANAGAAVGGENAVERLAACARALKLAAAGKPLTDGAIGTFRNRVLAEDREAKDVFVRGAPSLPALRAQSPAGTPELVSPGGGSATVQSIFNNPEPRRRNPAHDTIPGRPQERWSARRIAELLDQWMGGNWDGTKNEKQILDLLHGLNVADRRDIAVEYCKRRAARDKDLADPRGQPLEGDAALYALYRRLVRELDDSPFGETADGLAIKAYFDPKSPSGQLEATDVVMRGNAGAIHRMLLTCSTDQIAALDAALKKMPAGKGLDAWLRSKLSGMDERRALFLAHTARVGGKVPEADLLVFDLLEAARNPGLLQIGEWMRRGATDETAMLRTLHHVKTGQFVGALAPAFSRIAKHFGIRVEGDDGKSGQLRATALYHFLHGELKDSGELWLQRMALAAEGVHFDEKAAIAIARRALSEGGVAPSEEQVRQAVVAAEREQRARVATYVAITFRLAGEGGLDQADMVGVLGLVKPEKERSRFDGVPSVGEVRDVYRKFFGDRNMRMDVKRATDDALVTKLAEITLEGAGYRSAEAAAVRIEQSPEQAFEALHRPDLSKADRKTFLIDARAAFKRRTGTELRSHLAKKLGAEIVVNGRKIPSRAMVLEEHGVLTPADRVVFALYEKRGFLPFMKGPSGDEVIAVLKDLSPLERVVAIHEFGRIVGKPVDLLRGINPLHGEIDAHLRSEDAALAKRMASVMPHDLPALAFQIAAYLDRGRDPEVDRWVRSVVGDVDEWIARNVGDADPREKGAQRVGFAELQKLVAAAGGGPQFAAKVGMSTKEVSAIIGNIVRESRERGVAQMLGGLFRSDEDADAVHDAARASGAATRDAELYLAERGHLTPAHLERMARAEAEVVALVRVRLAHNRQDGALVGTIATGIVVAAALAAGASPALVLATGAVGKAALGDPRDWATNAVEGGAMSMLAYYAAGLPPSVNQWLRGINEGLAAAVGGGALGLQVGAGMGAVSWVTEGAPGFRSLFDRVMEGGSVGAVSGFVVGGALHYVEKAWNDAFGRRDMPPAQGGDNRPPIENPGAGGTVPPGTRPPMGATGPGSVAGNRTPIQGPSTAGGASPGNSRPPISVDAGGGVTTGGGAASGAASAQAAQVDMLNSAWQRAVAANAPAPVLELVWAGHAQAAADSLRGGGALSGEALRVLLENGRRHGIEVPQTGAPPATPPAAELERLGREAAHRALGATAR